MIPQSDWSFRKTGCLHRHNPLLYWSMWCHRCRETRMRECSSESPPPAPPILSRAQVFVFNSVKVTSHFSCVLYVDQSPALQTIFTHLFQRTVCAQLVNGFLALLVVQFFSQSFFAAGMYGVKLGKRYILPFSGKCRCALLHLSVHSAPCRLPEHLLEAAITFASSKLVCA